MKIVILQTDIVWANPSVNVEKADEIINRYDGVDIFVLPEMFSTGFCTNPEGIAEKSDSKTLEWMKHTAQRKKCAVAGSIALEDKGQYYNRFYFVHPGGMVEWYDKKHLFTYGGEHKRFTAGTKRVIVNYKDVRILLQVCYDLRFPVWSRNRNDYDMAFYVASWPTPRVEAWKLLLKARAVENQCYVVGANRVGDDSMCHYTGHAAIIDPYGRKISECNSEDEAVATAEINMERLAAFREKFPVLSDSDSFSIAGT